jgi:hypothetical protein
MKSEFSERRTSHFTPIQKATPKFIFKYIEYPKGVGISQSVHRWNTGRTAGFRFQTLQMFLFSTASISALRHTEPPIQWVPRALSSGVKRPEAESDNLTPSSAEVKNSGALLHCPIRIHGIVLHAGLLLAYCWTLKMETYSSKTSLDFQRAI